MLTKRNKRLHISRNPLQTSNTLLLRNITTRCSSSSKYSFSSYSTTDSLLLKSLFTMKSQFNFASFIFPITKRQHNINKATNSVTVTKKNNIQRRASIDISEHKVKIKSLVYPKKKTICRCNSVTINKVGNILEKNKQHNINSISHTERNVINVYQIIKNYNLKRISSVNESLLEKYCVLINGDLSKQMKMKMLKKNNNNIHIN